MQTCNIYTMNNIITTPTTSTNEPGLDCDEISTTQVQQSVMLPQQLLDVAYHADIVHESGPRSLPPSYDAVCLTAAAVAAAAAVSNLSQMSLPEYGSVVSTTTTTTNNDYVTNDVEEPLPDYSAGTSSIINKLNLGIDVVYQYKCILCLSVLLAILLGAYSIACFTIGFAYTMYNCDKPLAQWILVYGTIHLVLIPVGNLYLVFRNDYGKQHMLKIRLLLFTIFCLLACSWNIVGAVWVYSMRLQDSYVCPDILVQMSLWTSTVSLGLLVIFIISIFAVSLVRKYSNCQRDQ